jgi:hypothetical protein
MRLIMNYGTNIDEAKTTANKKKRDFLGLVVECVHFFSRLVICYMWQINS